jgi:hypothetical protein
VVVMILFLPVTSSSLCHFFSLIAFARETLLSSLAENYISLSKINLREKFFVLARTEFSLAAGKAVIFHLLLFTLSIIEMETLFFLLISLCWKSDAKSVAKVREPALSTRL